MSARSTFLDGCLFLSSEPISRRMSAGCHIHCIFPRHRPASLNISLFNYREETSNNRVRSGPKPKNAIRPIDQVPAAGARQGLSNGVETTNAGLAVADPEDPERSPGAQTISLNIPTSSRTLTVDVSSTSWKSSGEDTLRRSPSTTSNVELLSPSQRPMLRS